MGCYNLPSLKNFVLEIRIRNASKQSKVKHTIKQIRTSVSNPALDFPSTASLVVTPVDFD